MLIVLCGLQPLFFYASLLAVFGIEIMVDWLGRSFHKVSRVEYALLWFTFAAITQGRNTCSRSDPELLRTVSLTPDLPNNQIGTHLLGTAQPCHFDIYSPVIISRDPLTLRTIRARMQ